MDRFGEVQKVPCPVSLGPLNSGYTGSCPESFDRIVLLRFSGSRSPLSASRLFEEPFHRQDACVTLRPDACFNA